jgi:CheY-like chemotaxis protein
MELKKKRIALVNDDLLMMEHYSRFLEQRGYEAVPMLGSKKALELLPVMEPPDLLLVDHQMPEMTGPEFLKVLKEKHLSFFSCTCISGFSSMEPDSPMAQEFLDIGVHYARKVDTEMEFVQMIETQIRKCKDIH